MLYITSLEPIILDEMKHRVIDRTIDYIIDMEYFFVPNINKIHYGLVEMSYEYRYMDRDEDRDTAIRRENILFDTYYRDIINRGKIHSGIIVAEYVSEIIGFCVLKCYNYILVL